LSNVQIPNLPAAASASSSDLFEAVQGGVSVKLDLQQVLNLVAAANVSLYARLANDNALLGVQSIVAGSAALPTIRLSTDATTGHFFSSNVPAVAVAGVLASRTDAAGTTAAATTTVMTREKGDARFAPIVSDARLKKNVVDMPWIGVDTVMALRPVNYSWIANADDPKVQGMCYGLIAQEVRDVLPTATLGSDAAYLGVDPLSIIGVLVKAVQELNARIIALEGV
jgi:hypothetical protein